MEQNQLKKIRVMHAAALLSPSSGMLTQMDWEQEAANRLNINWQVTMYCPSDCGGAFKVVYNDTRIRKNFNKSFMGKVLAWAALRRNYYAWLLDQQDDIDIFVLRYYVHDPFQLCFVKFCRKPVYFVHHTLEVPELLLQGGMAGWFRASLEMFLGRWAIGYASGTIAMTKEISQFEEARSALKNKPQYIYPNGVVNSQRTLKDERSKSVPEFLFVANFSPWHGLDVLLRNIAESNAEIILHLVGDIPSGLSGMCNDPRIRLYGRLSHEEILVLSRRCWVGLASFALYRKKMKQACPLKVREYLNLGLPVYGDYQDVFPESSFFFRQGSGSIKDLTSFATETRDLSKNAVNTAAKKYIDKEALLLNLYECLARADHLES